MVIITNKTFEDSYIINNELLDILEYDVLMLDGKTKQFNLENIMYFSNK